MSKFLISRPLAAMLTMMPPVPHVAPSAGTANFYDANRAHGLFSGVDGTVSNGSGYATSLVGVSWGAELRLMTGAMPTSITSALTDCNPNSGNRSADILLRIPMTMSTSATTSQVGFFIDKPATGSPDKTSIYNSVFDRDAFTLIRNNVGVPKFTVAGDITWFWWVSIKSSSTANFTTVPVSSPVYTPLYQMIGTVSGPGGGGDIELSTTAATVGGTVSINYINVSIPTNFEW